MLCAKCSSDCYNCSCSYKHIKTHKQLIKQIDSDIFTVISVMTDKVMHMLNTIFMLNHFYFIK